MKQPEFIVNDGMGHEYPLSPCGYASLWGCDPCYDKSPRLPGDGYLFYNFNSKSSKEELQKFSKAISRTIEQVQISQNHHGSDWEQDIEDLKKLKEWVDYLQTI